MSRRIPRELRIAIRNDDRPVRKIAAEYGLSPTSVQKWKRRDDFTDHPRNPEGPPGIDAPGAAVFIELLRLSRYRYPKLMEYLAPVWANLPTQARRGSTNTATPINGTNKFRISRVFAPITIHRTLKRYASGALLNSFDRKIPAPGSAAIHQVRVQWQDGKSNSIKGDVILLQERASGLIYARAYHRIRERNIAVCIARFESMLGYDINALHFVTSTAVKDVFSDKVSLTTAFKYKRSRQDRTKISDTSGSDLRHDLTFNISLLADDDTPHQYDRIAIPGSYQNRQALNRKIEDLLNQINLSDRHYCFRDSRVEMTPLKRLLKQHKSTGEQVTENEVTRQIKLPRRTWYFIYDESSE